MLVALVTRLFHGTRNLFHGTGNLFRGTGNSLYFPLPWKHWISEALIKTKNALMLVCLGSFLMVTSSSCSPRPRAELRFPLPRYSYRSEWVHKPIYDLKQIALDIDQKRKGSLRDWRIYNEAGRRIEDGVRLIMLDRAANRSLADRVFLTRCLEQEGLVQRITYDSFCIYSSQLENLDERESRLRGHTGPSNLNGSLQLHRRSQVQGISLNFGHQTNRTLPISGSGNDSSSGNPLIVRANAHTFLPPWQDPPGLF